MHFISKCEEDTIEFASKFASKLNKKDIVILSGELGCRKNKICARCIKVFWIRK